MRASARSTTPIQASGNRPNSTAIRHASRNNSSRSAARTMSALMPLNTAYTRLSRLIFSSARFCSVMSCSVLNQRLDSAAADCSWSGSMTCRMCIHRSEEHTSELQSPCNLVCRLLLEKKKKKRKRNVDEDTSKSVNDEALDDAMLPTL